jgi:hypothetical protein
MKEPLFSEEYAGREYLKPDFLIRKVNSVSMGYSNLPTVDAVQLSAHTTCLIRKVSPKTMDDTAISFIGNLIKGESQPA